MAQSKRSAVWNFFEQKSTNVVVCKLCNVQLEYGNSTSAMNNHLKAEHPSGTSAGNAKECKRTVVKLSREHKNTHYASYTCSVVKSRLNRNLLTFALLTTMAAVG